MTSPPALRDEPLPVSIALVQNDSEVLRTPAYDLRGLLRHHAHRDHRHWRVESFSDRSFPSLLAAGGHFDAIVFGFNAIHNTPNLKEALNRSPPVTNILVLHQLDPDCIRFMRGRLKLGMTELSGSSKRDVEPTTSKNPAEESLLNWPEAPLDGEHLHAYALRYFDYEPQTVWRTVLEVPVGSGRVPVLVRTVSSFPQRIVACSLLLEAASSGSEEHRKLLLNMVDYCARGQPDVIVLAGEALDVARYRAAKLQLQGTNAVVVHGSEDASVSLSQWPIAGAARVLLPEAREEPEEWTMRGGIVVRWEDNRRLSLSTEATDADWVTVRWATWFRSVEPAVWLKRISSSRAVLNTLGVLRTRVGKHTVDDRVALPEPGDFRVEVHDRLAARLGPRLGVRVGVVPRLSFEQTISTTAAACDLRTLVGGVLPGRIQALRSWLRSEFETASLEDRLDIARCLQSAKLLRDAIDLPVAVPISALTVTRLFQAAVACKDAPTLPSWLSEGLESLPSAAELDGNLQLSASFLAATLAARSQFPGSVLGHPAEDAVDQAVATIARLGALPRLGAGDPKDVDPESISLEAEAMVRYMELDEASTSLIATRADSVSAKTLEGVLRETERARRAESEVKRAQLPLTAIFPLLAAAALTVLIGGIISAGHLFGVGSADLRVPWWLFPLLIVLVVVAYVISFGLLSGDRSNANRLLAEWTIVVLTLSAVGVMIAKFGDFESFLGIGSLLLAAILLSVVFVVLAALGLAPRAAVEIPQAVVGLDKLPGRIVDWARQGVLSKKEEKA